MWSGWAIDARRRLSRRRPGRPVAAPLYAMLGFDPATGRVMPGGGLAATPMARLRERTRDVLLAGGVTAGRRGTGARGGLARARPGRARRSAGRPAAPASPAPRRRPPDRGRHDRRPRADRTRRSTALGVAGASTRRSAPMTASRSSRRRTWSSTCARRSASRRRGPRSSATPPADLRMARAAGAGLVIGVLTGVGGRADLEPLADAVMASVEELQAGRRGYVGLAPTRRAHRLADPGTGHRAATR